MNKLFISKKNELNQKKKKGFTLIELVIVIAIIAILAAIAIPKFGASREDANQKADIATAKNIATIVAKEIAAGNITDKTASSTTKTITGTSADSIISNGLDGKIEPKAKAANGAATFTYNVNPSNDNIIVYYTGGQEVYPQWNKDAKLTQGTGSGE